MKSKTSFFSPAIYQKNMSRFWPIWGIAIFFSVVFPIGFLLKMTNYVRQGTEYTISTKYGFYSSVVDVVPALMFVYALVVAMATWNYMFSSRSIALMHSIPVNRTALYITNIASALTMLISPLIVFGVLYELVGISLGSGDVCALFTFWFMSICETLICFAIGTLAAMITGNIVALPALYLILNFLAAGLEYIIEDFAKGFIFGYSGSYKGILEFLSPLIFIANNVDFHNYDDNITLNGQGCVLIYGLVAIVILILTGIMYKKRRSESAGETICIYILKPIFTVIFSGGVAILLGRLIYYILGYNSDYYSKLPITLVVTFSGVVGYYGSTMLLKKTLAVFGKKNLPGLLSTVGALLVICILSSMDILNVEGTLPSVGEISSIDFSYANYDFRLTKTRDMEMIRELHKELINEKNLLIDATDDGYGYYNCQIVYRLKDGRKIMRNYPFAYINENLSDSNSFVLLHNIMEDRELLLGTIENLEENGYVNYVSIWGDNIRGCAFDMSTDVNEIFRAAKEDIAAGNYSYPFDINSDTVYIEFEILAENLGDSSYLSNYNYFKLVLTDSMVNTMQKLEEFGWNKADFSYSEDTDHFIEY